MMLGWDTQVPEKLVVSQKQVCVLHLSATTNMIRGFNNNKKVHTDSYGYKSYMQCKGIHQIMQLAG